MRPDGAAPSKKWLWKLLPECVHVHAEIRSLFFPLLQNPPLVGFWEDQTAPVFCSCSLKKAATTEQVVEVSRTVVEIRR